jgi:exodeoxyribonuclease-3
MVLESAQGIDPSPIGAIESGIEVNQRVASRTVCARLVDAGVDRGVRGEENASDHAPAWIALDL